MATLFKANGEIVEVLPKEENKFTLEELQELVGGYIELIPSRSCSFMIADDEGRIKEKPFNKEASERAKMVLVGDVVQLNEVEWKVTMH